MTAMPSPTLNRLAAVGILALLLAGTYFGVILPLSDDYQQTQASIAQSRNALDRYRYIAAALPVREAEMTALRQRAPARAGFLQGSNEMLVAAQIQNRVKALVESAHGELRSTQILPPQEDEHLRRVAVRCQMELTMAAVQQVFYGIETAYPLLFIDNLDMRTRAQRRREPPPGQEVTLDVRVDVYGYMAPSEKGGAVSKGKPAEVGAKFSAARDEIEQH